MKPQLSNLCPHSPNPRNLNVLLYRECCKTDGIRKLEETSAILLGTLIRSTMTEHPLERRSIPASLCTPPNTNPSPSAEESPTGGILLCSSHGKKVLPFPSAFLLAPGNGAQPGLWSAPGKAAPSSLSGPQKRADSCHLRSSHLSSLPQARVTSIALPFPLPFPSLR